MVILEENQAAALLYHKYWINESPIEFDPNTNNSEKLRLNFILFLVENVIDAYYTLSIQKHLCPIKSLYLKQY